MDAAHLLASERQVRAALPPLRRRLLGLLAEPASATELAKRTGIARQKINYHLRVLEQAGLVALVETRARRGCTERVLRATSADLVVDPELVGTAGRVRSRDTYAAEHLADVAADTVRTVARLRTGAEQARRRLLTFTLETEVAFGQPADVHAFADELATAVAELAARFDSPGGRRYRMIIGGHPALSSEHPSEHPSEGLDRKESAS